MSERVLRTTSPAGLDREGLPMRLFEKAKRRGVWNPSDLDFTADRGDWRALDEPERDLLLRLTALFQAGEESVALDLLPLIETVAAEGRLEEELYLATFLFEEAKHVDLFRRFLDEVAEERGDLSRYHGPSYRELVCVELPAALGRLRSDRSPAAQAEASVTYNMIVEGVLAETGYHGYFTVLDRRGILPGMRQGIERLQEDEARHIAYGVHLLSRLVAEHGEIAWNAIRARFERLVPLAVGVVGEIFGPYDPVPFGLSPDEFLGFAMTQFERRFARIERALRGEPAADDAEPGAAPV
ncbi:MAG TPA: R2-like ligand-binding oxidase [Thermoanaerobaculia bacterium]|nr:R2-like ligand-binding oxidase [Thermoanaerobaculia bacterium]